MTAAGSPQPNRPKAPKPAATKPLQVMQINRREEQEKLAREAAEARAAAEVAAEKARILEERAGLATPPRPAGAQLGPPTPRRAAARPLRCASARQPCPKPPFVSDVDVYIC